MYTRVLVLIFVLMNVANATTFKIQPINHQLKEAEGVFIGHYLKKKSVKLENGMIATQMIFKMNQEFGLQSDLLHTNEIIIHFPGGKFENEHIVVEGVPRFITGEKVALLVKSVENRYWGLNLGLGSFRVVNFGPDTILINSLFPTDQKVGQIKIEDFESQVRLIKGSNLKIVESPYVLENQTGERSPASVDNGKKRSIASKKEKVETNHSESIISNFWLIAVFALMGGIFRWRRSYKA